MMLPTLLTDTLKSIPWFFDFNAKQLERLASISAILEVKAGTTIFCEGDRVDNVYIILDGQVAVDSDIPGHGSVRIYQAEALDIIGWSKLTPIVRQRVATTAALKDSRLLVINGDGLESLCEEDNHIGFVIMRRIANVVATNMLTTKLSLMDLILQLSGEHTTTPSH
ncbi:MAG TPA: Crp/Fnr family transcriptional regulator [Bellilinea sp.]